jgi:hypothetical protein
VKTNTTPFVTGARTICVHCQIWKVGRGRDLTAALRVAELGWLYEVAWSCAATRRRSSSEGGPHSVRRDLLCVLNRTAILQIGGDAGSPESVTTGRHRQSSLPGAPLDHIAPPGTHPGGQRRGKCADTAGGCRCRQHFQPVQASLCQMALTTRAAKERSFAILRRGPGGLAKRPPCSPSNSNAPSSAPSSDSLSNRGHRDKGGRFACAASRSPGRRHFAPHPPGPAKAHSHLASARRFVPCSTSSRKICTAFRGSSKIGQCAEFPKV